MTESIICAKAAETPKRFLDEKRLSLNPHIVTPDSMAHFDARSMNR